VEFPTQFPTPLEVQSRGYVLTGFIDPGGSIDDYFFTVLKTHIPTAHIQVYGAMHWLLDEAKGVDFAKIRNDIAKLHLRNHFNTIGCELNNFGRGEVQQMRREYHINMYGVNTHGKVTSDKIIDKGETLDKHQMVKWTNSWRQAGHITFPVVEKQTDEIKKIIYQLDSFVVQKTDGTGGPSFKYSAEGTQHDDGIMSLLGNLFITKEKYLNISGYDARATGGRTTEGVTPEALLEEEKIPTPGRTLGSVSTHDHYDKLL